jgi:DNA-binding transcriptional LysR family regulator
VLFEDTYTCVAWAGNESIGESLTLEEYLELGHVVVNVAGAEPPGNYDEQFLRRANYQRRAEISVPAFGLAPRLVVGTDRITTIATRLAVQCAGFLPLKLIPLPIAMPPMVEMLQWHRVHDQDPANHWFRRLLRHAVNELPHEPPAIVSDRERQRKSRTRKTRASRPKRQTAA